MSNISADHMFKDGLPVSAISVIQEAYDNLLSYEKVLPANEFTRGYADGLRYALGKLGQNPVELPWLL